MTSTQDLIRIVLIGCGATLVMDLWLMFLKRIGIQTLNFAFIGRWVGHLFRGRFAHAAIAQAEPIPNELLLGWAIHYAIGIVFAGLLIGIAGVAWMQHPTWPQAVLVGVCTVGAPFLIMQPAMGAGIAGAKTPAPMKNRIRSVMNHAVFGFGLYGAAVLVDWVLR